MSAVWPELEFQFDDLIPLLLGRGTSEAVASDGISWVEEAHHVFFRGKRNVFRKSKGSQY